MFDSADFWDKSSSRFSKENVKTGFARTISNLSKMLSSNLSQTQIALPNMWVLVHIYSWIAPVIYLFILLSSENRIGYREY